MSPFVPFVPVRPNMDQVRNVIVIDTETTGLPKRNPDGRSGFYPAKQYWHYNNARVVQVAWIEMNARTGRVIGTKNFIIKPDAYVIPVESTNIHGISHDDAVANGVPFVTAANAMVQAMSRCDCLVAHNARFDTSVLLAEAYRYNMRDAVDRLYALPRFDTMWEGRKDLGLSKIPKLIDLYNTLHSSKVRQVHDALDDARLASKCMMTLLKRRRSSSYMANMNLRPRLSIQKPSWMRSYVPL